jgi:hypothetical protein
LSWMRIMVCPRTVMELMGPYTSLCLSQCWNSGAVPVGRSVRFPSRGSPLGPGGKGRLLLLEAQSYKDLVIITPTKRYKAGHSTETVILITDITTEGKRRNNNECSRAMEDQYLSVQADMLKMPC